MGVVVDPILLHAVQALLELVPVVLQHASIMGPVEHLVGLLEQDVFVGTRRVASRRTTGQGLLADFDAGSVVPALSLALDQGLLAAGVARCHAVLRAAPIIRLAQVQATVAAVPREPGFGRIVLRCVAPQSRPRVAPRRRAAVAVASSIARDLFASCRATGLKALQQLRSVRGRCRRVLALREAGARIVRRASRHAGVPPGAGRLRLALRDHPVARVIALRTCRFIRGAAGRRRGILVGIQIHRSQPSAPRDEPQPQCDPRAPIRSRCLHGWLPSALWGEACSSHIRFLTVPAYPGSTLHTQSQLARVYTLGFLPVVERSHHALERRVRAFAISFPSG